jgi:hypothetical protein
METTYSCETSVDFQRIMLCNIHNIERLTLSCEMELDEAVVCVEGGRQN